MERFRRAANGKRLFTTEFKREQVGRVLRGKVTIAELSRELAVSPSLVRRWKHLMQEGGQTAVAANGDVVPAYKLREAEQRIRELERALGRKTMEPIARVPRRSSANCRTGSRTTTSWHRTRRWGTARPASTSANRGRKRHRF